MDALKDLPNASPSNNGPQSSDPQDQDSSTTIPSDPPESAQSTPIFPSSIIETPKQHENNRKQVACGVCSKKMRSNHLKRHMKQHGSHPCQTCDKKFDRIAHLARHNKKARICTCTTCHKRFCGKDAYEQHKRTSHPPQTGRGSSSIEEDDWVKKLQEPIFLSAVQEATEEYIEAKRPHLNKISDWTESIENVYQKSNKEIPLTFTYENLRDLIAEQVYQQGGNAVKINLGFGSMLFNIITHEYRYYYVDSNSLLFDTAFTISKRIDIDRLMKKIYNLDLANTYYLKRPSSGWILVGLPNVEIAVYRLGNFLMG